MADKKLKKISIVFEENGEANGRGFKVYLSGDIDEIKPERRVDSLSPAEYWSTKVLSFVADMLAETGSLKGVDKNGKKI